MNKQRKKTEEEKQETKVRPKKTKNHHEKQEQPWNSMKNQENHVKTCEIKKSKKIIKKKKN